MPINDINFQTCNFIVQFRILSKEFESNSTIRFIIASKQQKTEHEKILELYHSIQKLPDELLELLTSQDFSISSVSFYLDSFWKERQSIIEKLDFSQQPENIRELLEVFKSCHTKLEFTLKKAKCYCWLKDNYRNHLQENLWELFLNENPNDSEFLSQEVQQELQKFISDLYEDPWKKIWQDSCKIHNATMLFYRNPTLDIITMLVGGTCHAESLLWGRWKFTKNTPPKETLYYQCEYDYERMYSTNEDIFERRHSPVYSFCNSETLAKQALHFLCQNRQKTNAIYLSLSCSDQINHCVCLKLFKDSFGWHLQFYDSNAGCFEFEKAENFISWLQDWFITFGYSETDYYFYYYTPFHMKDLLCSLLQNNPRLQLAYCTFEDNINTNTGQLALNSYAKITKITLFTKQQLLFALFVSSLENITANDLPTAEQELMTAIQILNEINSSNRQVNNFILALSIHIYETLAYCQILQTNCNPYSPNILSNYMQCLNIARKAGLPNLENRFQTIANTIQNNSLSLEELKELAKSLDDAITIWNTQMYKYISWMHNKSTFQLYHALSSLQQLHVIQRHGTAFTKRAIMELAQSKEKQKANKKLIKHRL